VSQATDLSAGLLLQHGLYLVRLNLLTVSHRLVNAPIRWPGGFVPTALDRRRQNMHYE